MFSPPHEPENVMKFRHGTDNATVRPIAWAFEDFHEWVLSLPWVVERLNDDVVPAVRCFAVDCEPLGRRQTLLLTGLEQRRESDGPSIAVVVPAEAACAHRIRLCDVVIGSAS